MSWQLRLLNPLLRTFGRPVLARTPSAEAARRNLELKARLFFRLPKGTGAREINLTDTLAARRITPPGASETRILLYFHGGGYVFGSPHSHGALAAQIAARIGATAIMPYYPLAPEHPFPAAHAAALAAYTACRDQLGATKIIIGGDSAGGGLALALLGTLVQQGTPLPTATIAFSPLTNMHCDAESYRSNAATEVVLPPERVKPMAETYLNGADPSDPRASPVFGTFTGAPPVWITVGDREIFLDDARQMADVLRGQDVDVTLSVQPNLPHVWPLMSAYLPEGRATLDELAAWLRPQLRYPAES